MDRDNKSTISPILIDTGSTINIFRNLFLFSNFNSSHVTAIGTANGDNKNFVSSGSGHISLPFPNFTLNLFTHYVPSSPLNILSHNSLEDHNLFFLATNNQPGHIFSSITQKPLIKCIKKFGLHYLPYPPESDSLLSFAEFSNFLIQFRPSSFSTIDQLRLSNADKISSDNLTLLHNRFGHLSDRRLALIIKSQPSLNLPIHRSYKIENCQICLQSSMNKAPYSSISDHQIHPPGSFLYFDLAEVNPPHLTIFPWALVATDHSTRYCWTALLKTKDEALVHAIRIIESMTTQNGLHVQTVRTDPGELYSNAFKNYLDAKLINFEPSLVRQHEMNGRVERAIQTISRLTLALQLQAKAPPNQWGFAWEHAVYLKNRLPLLKANITSPIEHLTGIQPILHHIRVYGCLAFYYVDKEERLRFEPRSKPAIYIGCHSPSIAKLIDLTSGQAILRRFQNIRFDEAQFPQWPLTRLTKEPTTLKFLESGSINPSIADNNINDYLSLRLKILNAPLDTSLLKDKNNFRQNTLPVKVRIYFQSKIFFFSYISIVFKTTPGAPTVLNIMIL